MAMTNAERQAALKVRRQAASEALSTENEQLKTEVAELRALVEELRERAHKSEIALLREKLKNQSSNDKQAAKPAAKKPVVAPKKIAVKPAATGAKKK